MECGVLMNDLTFLTLLWIEIAIIMDLITTELGLKKGLAEGNVHTIKAWEWLGVKGWVIARLGMAITLVILSALLAAWFPSLEAFVALGLGLGAAYVTNTCLKNIQLIREADSEEKG